ncbi:MAG TPA: histidinol dehydrogenase [Gemmatimonadales bacterium]|nr:histidinol dehydrogenase [Gemmatimonadales bacterium]
MNARLLPLRSVPELARRRRDPVSKQALAEAAPIVDAVRTGGEAALREYAERFGDVRPEGGAGAGAPLFYDRAALREALARLPAGDRARLERVAERIRGFAEAQYRALCPVAVSVPGGVAEHQIAPVERAGCYAPGGRYPLPSSVLMTAVTARVAGVRDVWVASPKPHALSLAAAAIAGADGVLAAGGAHAIAALAYGAGPIAPRDIIVGPGNRYVTAAKQLVAGAVAIDMLAGPSELTVFADDGADPGTVAADLLAQAEHDPDAVPVLVALDARLPDRVETELTRQLCDLPSAAIARAALANGGVVVVASLDEGIAACDAIAPEHLQLELRDAAAVAPRLGHYGALFVGAGAAEVLGDYGAGPNHVLPTGGTARSTGGLSVYTFLRVRTWLRIDDRAAAVPLIEDAIWLGRAEGLEAHARAAERRLVEEPDRMARPARGFPTP